MENEKNTFKEDAPMNVKGKEENRVKYFLFPRKKGFLDNQLTYFYVGSMLDVITPDTRNIP